MQEELLLFSFPLVRQGAASQRSRWQPPEATLWRLWVPTVSCSLMPCLCPSHPQGLTNSSSHLLEEKLLHHVVQSAVQRRVVEQRRRRAKPAVKMNDLVVCIDVVVLRDLLHPAHHHALQNPAGEQRTVTPPPATNSSFLLPGSDTLSDRLGDSGWELCQCRDARALSPGTTG